MFDTQSSRIAIAASPARRKIELLRKSKSTAKLPPRHILVSRCRLRRFPAMHPSIEEDSAHTIRTGSRSSERQSGAGVKHCTSRDRRTFPDLLNATRTMAFDQLNPIATANTGSTSTLTTSWLRRSHQRPTQKRSPRTTIPAPSPATWDGQQRWRDSGGRWIVPMRAGLVRGPECTHCS